MKSVRIYFTKMSRLKFVSHLDMNRFMTRALRKTDIPVWYTEGFNKRVYLNFALPLTLGFESECEIMDIKITDDSYPLEKIKEQLNSVTPDDLTVYSVKEPVLKCSEIGFAKFSVCFFEQDLTEKLNSFFLQKEILCRKKTKKGDVTQIDVANKVFAEEISFNGNTLIKIILPAGNTENINPAIVIDAFKDFCEQDLPYFEITRNAILDKNKNLFI